MATIDPVTFDPRKAADVEEFVTATNDERVALLAYLKGEEMRILNDNIVERERSAELTRSAERAARGSIDDYLDTITG